jgi:hypothetical protein
VDDSTYGPHTKPRDQINYSNRDSNLRRRIKKEREGDIRVNGICSKSHQTLKLLWTELNISFDIRRGCVLWVEKFVLVCVGVCALPITAKHTHTHTHTCLRPGNFQPFPARSTVYQSLPYPGHCLHDETHITGINYTVLEGINTFVISTIIVFNFILYKLSFFCIFFVFWC